MPRMQHRRKKRVLVFTDSRGELKPTFPRRKIFTEKIKSRLESHGYAVDMLLCPFKWTTTLDFIELIETKSIEIDRYERVVLYTGVVEWSPRNESSFRTCIKGAANERVNIRTFLQPARPGKITNRKTTFFRQFFGAKAFDQHARTHFDTEYRGERTQNLISLAMLERKIIPYLKQTIGDRLIFINTNRIVPGWEGNYTIKNPDGRPRNIRIIEDYAALMSEHFSNGIDLMKWSDRQIRRFTVDNMHLTHAGSEWIFERLMKRLSGISATRP